MSDAAPSSLAVRVQVQDVSIPYRTTFERRPTWKQWLVHLGRGERAVHEVEALRQVGFDIRVGTSLRVIGADGAGKSTLLRAIAGILPPISGHVEV